MQPDRSLVPAMAATDAPQTPPEARVSIRQLEGKQLLGTARHRAIVTDRKAEHGGTDVGFTSGELFLLSIGSCAMGSVRSFFEARGARCAGLAASVFFEPVGPGAADRLVIEFLLPSALAGLDGKGLVEAAVSGGVTSRIRSCNQIEVRITPTSPAPLSNPEPTQQP